MLTTGHRPPRPSCLRGSGLPGSSRHRFHQPVTKAVTKPPPAARSAWSAAARSCGLPQGGRSSTAMSAVKRHASALTGQGKLAGQHDAQMPARSLGSIPSDRGSPRYGRRMPADAHDDHPASGPFHADEDVRGEPFGGGDSADLHMPRTRGSSAAGRIGSCIFPSRQHPASAIT
jgi:hypothetical protein